VGEKCLSFQRKASDHVQRAAFSYRQDRAASEGKLLFFRTSCSISGVSEEIAYNGNGYSKPPLGVRLRSFLPYKPAKLIVFNTIKEKVFGRSAIFCIGGGALLDVKQQEFFAALGLPVYQGYGLTEAAAAPRDGWLWTGDLASMDKDGFLVVVGREKALLIAEDGEKYSPEEIEEAVASSTDVIDRIIAYCDHRKYAIALVTLDTNTVEAMVKSGGIGSAEALRRLFKLP
jgi:long-subunit acyl-CoA synthetase (AMP-forming)